MNDKIADVVLWLYNGREKPSLETEVVSVPELPRSDEQTAYLRLEDNAALMARVQSEGKSTHQVVPRRSGRSVLVELLRSSEPLDREIRDALAGVLDLDGSSRMKVRLEPRRKGRPPKSITQRAVDEQRAAQLRQEKKARGLPRDLALKDAAEARGESRSMAYKRRKMLSD